MTQTPPAFPSPQPSYIQVGSYDRVLANESEPKTAEEGFWESIYFTERKKEKEKKYATS